ncbi:hypothetical protein [Hyphococcus sp.]|uniref:hypothetical protein n=1 Tax=Hyphococcus sp. TaxID=2038636 RepID=UPI00207FEAA2|nr:MAG: ATP-binding protein [Marinicaulis sp.]
MLDDKTKISTTTKILKLLEEKSVDFFHSPQRTLYAKVPLKGVKWVLEIGSEGFADYLQRLAYKELEKSLRPTQVEEITAVCRSKALYDGEERRVFIRTAPYKAGSPFEGIEIDLGDDTGQCVRITKGEIRLTEPSVEFFRPDNFQPLPRPSEEGSLRQLFDFVNVTNPEQQIAVMAFMVAAAFPEADDYPLLFLTGEQGAGKSFATELIASIIDPRTSTRKAMPRSEQDIAIIAARSHLMAFDNLSYLKTDVADILCRISTGGSFETRKLYSNTGVTEINIKKPVILNSIVDLMSRPDVVQRTFIVELESIAADTRKVASELRAEFERDRPEIFGGLCRALQKALGRYSSVKIEKTLRLAGAAKLAAAASPAFDSDADATVKALIDIQGRQKQTLIAVNPVCQAIAHLMDDHQVTKVMTPTDLYNALTSSFNQEANPKPNDWPRTVSAFGKELQRQTDNLRSIDIEVGFKRSGTARMITLTRKSPPEITEITARVSAAA